LSVRIGISSCLLGMKVRFDAGHKLDRYVTDTLGEHFEFVAVCPEVEAGFGVPRPTVHLAGPLEAPRMVVTKSGEDVTERMVSWARARVDDLERMELDGYILKKSSPSCGMERVKVSEGKGAPRAAGRGIFAAELIRRMPLLPVEEEGRLQDMGLRENFIERVFAHHRWRQFLASDPAPRDLVAWHTGHKMTLLAHGRPAYTRLGRIVAEAGKRPIREVLDEYGREFMLALRTRATRGRQGDVLLHLAGHFKKVLASDDRAELVGCIDEYRRGRVPMVVPLTLLRHHLRHHPDPWVAEQVFLQPYPAELMLRNHV
jgi:uncharacterized protein YbgA (DUF1722 family)/uncharacterized protein YbbK (DUF523 family)